MHTHMETCITRKYVDARKRTGSYRMNTPVRQAMANRLLEATLFDLCALLSWSLAKLGGENFGRRLSQVLLLFGMASRRVYRKDKKHLVLRVARI